MRRHRVILASIALAVCAHFTLKACRPRALRVVFSDVDGTLAHYAWQLKDVADVRSSLWGGSNVSIRYRRTGEERVCRKLASRSSGDAYVSFRSLALVKDLRSRGVVFALISGARSSTYLQRRALLPAADFEAFESGGRLWRNGEPDMVWSRQVESVTGFNGTQSMHQSLEARPESLWVLYRELRERGMNVDAAGYETQFRIRLNPDDTEVFEAEVVPRLAGLGLAHAINLGKVDVFPAMSGKANVARHILQQLGLRGAEAAFMFDDDNDLELADLCAHCLLPGVAHDRVRRRLVDRPHWRVMPDIGPLGTEGALESILQILQPTRARRGV